MYFERKQVCEAPGWAVGFGPSASWPSREWHNRSMTLLRIRVSTRAPQAYPPLARVARSSQVEDVDVHADDNQVQLRSLQPRSPLERASSRVALAFESRRLWDLPPPLWTTGRCMALVAFKLQQWSRARRRFSKFCER